MRRMNNKSARRAGAGAPKKKGIAQTKAQRKSRPKVNLKIKNITDRLTELEDEKAKIEQMIRLLQIKKGAKGAREQQQMAVNMEVNEAASEGTDVSSLNSRAIDDAVANKRSALSDDEISIMTENIYHYDARGRKIDDDAYGAQDTETVIAHFQNGTGHCNYNQPTSKSKPDVQPAVVIEWARGKGYRPTANLADDDVLHQHPTDISLMVGDDKSFYDELSLSSGEDSKLAVAFTDMPMEIDLGAKEDDDESVNSGFHSECSISVAAQPVEIMSRSKASKHNHKTLKQTNPEAPGRFLYQRTESLDHSDEPSDPKRKSSRRRKRPGTDGEPLPPLTTDMSLVDGKEPKDANEKRKPPIEISFSESVSGVESLGSEMGGASLSQDPQQQPANEKSKCGKGKGSAETTNNKPDQKKSKKSKSKEAIKDNNNMLGERDSTTEENELSVGALNFSKEELLETSDKKNYKQEKTTGDAKSPNRTNKKAPAKDTSKKTKRSSAPSDASMHSSLSSFAASGIDTEAGVAAPRRASLPTLPKSKSKGGGKVPTKNASKSSRKAGVGASSGVNKKGNKEGDKLKQQNSNSTCNSSLTSLPEVTDNNGSRGLVIEGAALVKQKS